MTKKTVLILYQGKKSRSMLELVIAKVSKALPYVQPVLLGSGENSFKASVLSKLLDYINLSDAAVALVALDRRIASKEAGNLWFEIGLWYGIKPPSDLLVLVQKHKDVKLPSDVFGQIVPRVNFDNDAKIESEITKFLYSIFEKQKRDDKYRCVDKIRDTLLSPKRVFPNVEDLFMCDKAPAGACANKEALFCFTSELLRMNKNGWEHNCIQYALLEISRLTNCLELAHTRRVSALLNEKIDVGKSINAFNIQLFKAVKYIEIFTSKYLQRSRINDYLPWKKFEVFLHYRLDVAIRAYDVKDFPLENHAVLQPMLRKLPDFVGWAENFGQNSDLYDLDRSKEPDYDTRLYKAYACGQFAYDMAAVLFGIGGWNFDTSYSAFKTEFKRNSNKAIIPSVLMGLTKKLPHAVNERAPKIWPRKP